MKLVFSKCRAQLAFLDGELFMSPIGWMEFFYESLLDCPNGPISRCLLRRLNEWCVCVFSAFVEEKNKCRAQEEINTSIVLFTRFFSTL